jgi:hypothetical protein
MQCAGANGTIGGKKLTQRKMWVLIFSTTFEAYLILRRIQTDIVTNLYRYSSKVTIMIVGV